MCVFVLVFCNNAEKNVTWVTLQVLIHNATLELTQISYEMKPKNQNKTKQNKTNKTEKIISNYQLFESVGKFNDSERYTFQ